MYMYVCVYYIYIYIYIYIYVYIYIHTYIYIGTCGGQCRLSWLQGDTIRNSPECDSSGNQRTYRKFEVEIAVKLTPPSPDTCYGAAVVIETLNASCPGDPTWGGARHMYSCGAHVRGGTCPSFISTFDDRKFALVKAGLQVSI